MEEEAAKLHVHAHKLKIVARRERTTTHYQQTDHTDAKEPDAKAPFSQMNVSFNTDDAAAPYDGIMFKRTDYVLRGNDHETTRKQTKSGGITNVIKILEATKTESWHAAEMTSVQRLLKEQK